MIQLKNYNLFSLFSEKIDDSTFFYYKDNAVTYLEAHKKIQFYISYLQEMNVAKGDRVLLSLPNRPEFVYLFLAIASLGAVSVLVNPGYKVYEMNHIVSDSSPGICIVEKEFKEYYEGHKDSLELGDRLVAVDTIDVITSINVPEKIDYVKLQKDDAATIIYTAATGGKALGAVLSHNNMYIIVEMMEQSVPHPGTILSVLPFYHSFGLTSAFLMPMCYRQVFYLMDSFEPKELVSTITTNRISTIFAVPQLYRVLNMFHKDDVDYSFLKLCITGGEFIDVSVQYEFEEKFGVELRDAYGLTEAAPIVTMNILSVKNKIGSVGLVLPWNEVKITDREMFDGNEVGEVLVKGENVFLGYYGSKEETDRSLRDGWLYTGDLGYLDDEGYLFLTGLKKEMMLHNGFNVYPAEVEQILMNHEDVISAHCSIRHSPRSKLIAEIVTGNRSLTEGGLKEWCKVNMTKYKHPRSFKITFAGNS